MSGPICIMFIRYIGGHCLWSASLVPRHNYCKSITIRDLVIPSVPFSGLLINPQILFLCFVNKLFTNSSLGISGMIPLLECSLIKWYRALYFQMVCGFPENDKEQIGQGLGCWCMAYYWRKLQHFCTACIHNNMDNLMWWWTWLNFQLFSSVDLYEWEY